MDYYLFTELYGLVLLGLLIGAGKSLLAGLSSGELLNALIKDVLLDTLGLGEGDGDGLDGVSEDESCLRESGP